MTASVRRWFMTASLTPPPSSHDFLAGGGEMGALMRATDWSKTPLGPPASWPQSLRTAVSIMLESRFAMVVAWGPEFRFFYNDRYKPILGAKHPAALGSPGGEIFPEVWKVVGPEFERVRRGESFAVDDWLLPLDRNGYLENCWFTLSYSPIRDESGGVGGLLAVVAETTGRVEGERRLAVLKDLARRASEAKNAAHACESAAAVFAESTLDVPFSLIYLLDPGGRTLRLAAVSGLERGGPAAPESLELSEQAAWPLADVVGDRRACVLPGLDGRFGSLPGGPHPEKTHTAILLPLARPGSDRAYGALVAGVSPRRALDDRYRSFFELAAEHIVAGLGNAAAWEEERRRAEALAEIDRAKTAFFSNVGHEFRTPLTLLLGPLQDALSAEKPLEGEDLAAAHRNALRLLKLVDTLLDVARVEAGRAEAVFEAVDLAALTSDLASSFRSAVERAGLRFRVDCPPLGRSVYVDRSLWEKIVLNLLSNAFKHTFEGEISVSLRLRDGRAVLAVSDTGIGIPPEELPRIFDRFHRVKGARSRSHEGTGIGLSLVRELVKLHKGSVDAASVVGKGTVLEVSLPLGSAHLPADRIGARPALPSTALGADPYVEEARQWLPDGSAAPAPSPSASPQAPAPPPRILLADDNADMRGYLRRLLEGRWTVETVADGRAALTAAQKNPPDLILADVMMPGLDGFALLRELRADPRTRVVPVIMISARAGEEARVEGIRAGADDYLVKPFSAPELLARIQAHIRASSTRRDLEDARGEAEALYEVSRALAAELDLDKLVQKVTDAGTELTGAHFGAFFYNVDDGRGGSYLLYTLSGAPREAFEKLGLPRNTPIFQPTFQGDGPVRIADVRSDPRYGKVGPHHGMPPGHLPVRSYLAVPVKSRSGEVLGGLFFGHSEPGVFTERSERMGLAVAAHAAVALDNARLLESARRQGEAAEKAAEDLRLSEERYRLAIRASNDVLWDWSAATGQVVWSDALRTVLGHDPAQASGPIQHAMAWWTEHIHPDDRARVSETFHHALESGGDSWLAEYRFRRGDGAYATVLDRGHLLRDAAGAMTRFIGSMMDITERKKSEIALKESEEQLLLALHAARMVAWEWDAVNDVVRATANRADIYGQAKIEKAEQGFALIHPDDRERHRALVDGAVKSGEPYHSEFRIVRPEDGDVVWLAEWGRADFDESGRLRKISGVVMDITERRRADRRLEVLVSSIDDHLVTYDHNWRYTFVNEPAARVLGKSREELLGKCIWDLFPDAVGNQYYRELHAAAQGKRVVSSEHFYPPFNKWFENRFYPSEEGVTVFSTDVTARKRAEAALRESEERFRNLADTAPVMIWMSDAEGRAVYLNKAWLDFTGRPHEKELGHGWTESVHPEDLPRCVETFMAALGKREPFRMEYRVRRHDGEYRWVLDNGIPRFAPDGAYAGCIGSIIDVSDTKNALETVHRMNADLERRVRERTGELVQANSALEKARDQALEAVRAKSQFLANMSHEIRTPLNAVIGLAGLLLRGGLPPEPKSQAETLRASADALMAVINNILNFSKIEAGKMSLQEVDFDPRALVEETAGLLAGDARAKGLRFEVACGGLPAASRGDPERLRQVLINLIGNAVKFTEAGRVAVRSDAELREAGLILRVEVEDSGVGVPDEDMQRIFEPFTQADPTMTRRFGGTGLGLAISKQIVELMGGTIGARRRPEGGSLFWLQVPLKRPSEENVVAKPDSAPSRIPKGVRILVVEDNAVNQKVVLAQLRSLGAEADCAANGREAVQAMSRRAYDLVLMDCQMPVLDGYSATREIRLSENASRTPIVAMTAHAMEGDREKCLAAGMDDYIAKPVHIEDLSAALAKWAGRGFDAEKKARASRGNGGPAAERPKAASRPPAKRKKENA
jgi:PAS domain S-box-containing protein